jgi:phosphoglycerate dehydrogenase-like enzyme
MDGFVSEQLLRRGLLVTNSSGIYAPSMVEYVIAMLVSIRRNLPRYLTSQRDHVWLPGDPFLDGELRGKRVGIIGYGGVGRLLASVMDGLGMEVWASDVQPPPEAAMSYLARFVSSGDLPLLLEASDCIVVACPLTSKTRGMIGANELSKMRRGTILVNIARGPIVDEGALLEALSSGHLGAAVLDVAAEEPLPPTSPLWEAPNLLITPHISGDTLEGWERTMSLFCGNLGLYIDGNPEQMTNLVDLKAHI